MALASPGTRKSEEVPTVTTRSFDLSPSNGHGAPDPLCIFTHLSLPQWQASTLATHSSPLLVLLESSNLLVSPEAILEDNKAGTLLFHYSLAYALTSSFIFAILEAERAPLNSDAGDVDDEGDMPR